MSFNVRKVSEREKEERKKKKNFFLLVVISVCFAFHRSIASNNIGWEKKGKKFHSQNKKKMREKPKSKRKIFFNSMKSGKKFFPLNFEIFFFLFFEII